MSKRYWLLDTGYWILDKNYGNPLKSSFQFQVPNYKLLISSIFSLLEQHIKIQLKV